jgi:hypothetical protein
MVETGEAIDEMAEDPVVDHARRELGAVSTTLDEGG